MRVFPFFFFAGRWYACHLTEKFLPSPSSNPFAYYGMVENKMYYNADVRALLTLQGWWAHDPNFLCVD